MHPHWCPGSSIHIGVQASSITASLQTPCAPCCSAGRHTARSPGGSVRGRCLRRGAVVTSPTVRIIPCILEDESFYSNSQEEHRHGGAAHNHGDCGSVFTRCLGRPLSGQATRPVQDSGSVPGASGERQLCSIRVRRLCSIRCSIRVRRLCNIRAQRLCSVRAR